MFQQQRLRLQEVTATSILSDFISIPLEPSVRFFFSFMDTPFLVQPTTYPAVVRDAKVEFIMIIRRTEVRLTTLKTGFPSILLFFFVQRSYFSMPRSMIKWMSDRKNHGTSCRLTSSSALPFKLLRIFICSRRSTLLREILYK